MPRVNHGDMWDAFDSVDLFIITTNASITRLGKLVMGRGIAAQAVAKYPGIEYALAVEIEQKSQQRSKGLEYGFFPVETVGYEKFGVFQVKWRWDSRADPYLITASAAKLSEWCTANPDKKVALNYPGIGNGKLTPAIVWPLISKLPNQVEIWRYSNLLEFPGNPW